MGISLNKAHLKRYKDLAFLFMKYGHGDLVKHAGLEKVADGPATPSGSEAAKTPPAASELADDLERLGPTFIKLGQLLSTRSDILPAPYVEALARLQDKVEPFPFADVEKIIFEELGVRIHRAFQSMDPVPIAAASLGQVHKAILRDGRAVAVKVQRPHVRECMIEDLDALHEVAEFLDKHTAWGDRYHFSGILDELRRSLLRELDYRQEAQNLRTLGTNLAEFPHLVVPQPVDDYTTGRVLTMQYISGQKLTDLSPVVRLEIKGGELAEELFQAYLQQILVDGFFHADPHPGNVFLTQDSRIALLDLGMVARLSPTMQEDLLQLLLALSDGRSDDAAEIAIRIGIKRDDFDEKVMRQRTNDIVGQNKDSPLRHIQIGRIMMEVTRSAGECGIRLPAEMTMLGKTLLNLDQIGTTLDPNFDPTASMRHNAARLMRQRMLRGMTAGNLFSRMLEVKDFVQRLPHRVNRILDAVANNELEVKVHAIDESRLMAGFQKVANRITLGLILAALIIGAAMLTRVPTTFVLFGYPGLAIIFFLLAALGGVVLMYHILFRDETPKNSG